MASPNPLDAFHRINSDLYLQPPRSSAKTEELSPSLIILCPWSGAQSRHIARYIAMYNILYPSARILLVTSSLWDFFYLPATSSHGQLEPAVRLLCDGSGTRVLAHVFSNGGALKLSYLAIAYRELVKDILPIQLLVLDSAPGKLSYVQTLRNIPSDVNQTGYWRLLSIGVAYSMLLRLWAMTNLFGWRNTINQLRRDLNDPTIIRSRTRRCYIYAKTDQVVDWEAVEMHIEDGEKQGWNIRKEEFVGSGHVAHVRVDENRYWNVIKSCWDESSEEISRRASETKSRVRPRLKSRL